MREGRANRVNLTVHHKVQLWSHEDTRVKSLYRYLWQVYFSGYFSQLVSTTLDWSLDISLIIQAPELFKCRNDGSMTAKENNIC